MGATTHTVPRPARPARQQQQHHHQHQQQHQNQDWGRRNGRYERPFERPGHFNRHWHLGDIAYLLPEDAFPPDEHKALIQPPPGCRLGYLPAKATGHPVIILSQPTEKSTHVLVTPVSAYSSGDFNNYLPPWKQEPHKWKYFQDFRSFHGCERYCDKYPPLYLEGDKSMPKPRASWLYVQSLWAVPLTVIGKFTKVRDFLRVRQDSVDSLLSHMQARCRRWKECMSEMEVYERAANGIRDSSPIGIPTWREAPSAPRRYTPPAAHPPPPHPSSSTATRGAISPPKTSSAPFSYASVAKLGKTTDNTNGTRTSTATAQRSSANTGPSYQHVDHHAKNVRQPQQSKQQSSSRPALKTLGCMDWRTVTRVM